MTFLGLVGYYWKFIKKFCLYSKTTHNSYASWCKIWLDTDPPTSIHQPKSSPHTSTHNPLSRPFKMKHSIHWWLWWHLWSSTITETQWPGIATQISLKNIHGHSMQMEHSQTRSLCGTLCHNQMELLLTGIWDHHTQWPQTLSKMQTR